MTKEDLILAMEKANSIFKAVMVNYQGLKGYLVLSSPHGQCEPTEDTLKILREFPRMISESEFKDKGDELLESVKGLESELKYIPQGNRKTEIQEKISAALNPLYPILEKLEFKEETFIEIRFGKPILDLIFKMQKDPLVAQEHTPQTKASIRIVLGTLEELCP